MLAVIVCCLVLALTYPIRAYVGQRGDIRRLEQEHSAAQERVEVLEQRRAQWDDPAYVEGQARERLRYVRPGEKLLIVTGPAPTPAATPAAVPERVAAPDDPWYDRLWSTVDAAGASRRPGDGRTPAKTPATAPAR